MVCMEDWTVVDEPSGVGGGCQVKEEWRLGLEKINLAGNWVLVDSSHAPIQVPNDLLAHWTQF